MPEDIQWWAICDKATGEAISFGTSLGDFGDRYIAYKVDGPPDGRPWDAATKTFGPKSAPSKPPLQKAREAYATAVTADEKIAALAIVLGVAD